MCKECFNRAESPWGRPAFLQGICYVRVAVAITVEGQLCATVWTTRTCAVLVLLHMCLPRTGIQSQLLLLQQNQQPAPQQLLQHSGKCCHAVSALDGPLQALVLYANHSETAIGNTTLRCTAAWADTVEPTVPGWQLVRLLNTTGASVG